MGEVEVMRSEILQFECKGTKNMTEKDVYNAQSFVELMPGEESSQSTDDKMIHDFQAKGYMQYG